MADKTKDIESLMHEKRTFKHSRKDAWINDPKEYEALYRHSMEDPEGFWGKRAEELIHWDRKWDKVLEYDFFKPEINWFLGGNISGTGIKQKNCRNKNYSSHFDPLYLFIDLMFVT